LNARIAVDVGGTFTDLAYVGSDGELRTHKLLSTPLDYSDAVVEGIITLADREGLPLESIDDVLHGCTVATNAIVEHRGAKTALVTTAGFRDVLELRRIRVPRLYDPLYVKPEPLVPRRLCFEVNERVDANGEIIRPLDKAQVERVAVKLAAMEIEAIAVCLLHSYVNPSHEQTVGHILKNVLPNTYVTLSVDVLPQIREYERTSTTVVNAYVGPPVKRYLQSMIRQLNASGIRCRFMVMQSSGGILNAHEVTMTPAQIVECGPAAGVIGAARLGELSQESNLISFDMGGTTAKASMIESGQIKITDEYDVGGRISSPSRLTGGYGYALKLPAIDISEVGAGGGSIVWLDKAGSIKVGPESAGAVPGPACYGFGGQRPTVTDANTLLGYINPESIAGGAVPIDRELAARAVQTQIAQPLGKSLVETAFGIHRVANANMMRAIKAVTTNRGRDPRDFTMIAFGGSGGVHAVALARELRIQRVLFPPAAGVFSALGLLASDSSVNITQNFRHDTANWPVELAGSTYEMLQQRIAERLQRPMAEIDFQRYVDIRYVGQAYELSVPFRNGPIGVEAVRQVEQNFESEHQRCYGHAATDDPRFETVNLRMIGTIGSAGIGNLRASQPENRSSQSDSRSAYFGPNDGLITTSILSRSDLTEHPLSGPFIVEETEATLVVPPDARGHCDAVGNIVIELMDVS